MKKIDSKKELKAICEDIIENAIYLRQSWFWGGSKGHRERSELFCESLARSYEFSFRDREYCFEQHVVQSRKHTYVTTCYSVDGEIKDLRLVRKLLKIAESEGL